MAGPTLSVCMITQDMAHFLPFLLRQVTPLADEVVVVDGGSRDGTPEAAAAFPGVRVIHHPFDGNLVRQKNFLIEQASCDWIFVIDSDELMGDRLRGSLPRLIRTRRYTHYKFPRYWVVDTDPYRYVRSEKLYPDFQLRLFRNLPFFRYTDRSTVHGHFPRQGRGPGRKMRRCHLFHFDFLLNDRARREAKVRRYTEIDPVTAGTSAMYLWEEKPHRIRRCREPLSGFDPERLPPERLAGRAEFRERGGG